MCIFTGINTTSHSTHLSEIQLIVVNNEICEKVYGGSITP